MSQDVKVKDQRYAVVEDAIFGAFCQLCESKAPERITVSDVIRRAGIVRSTFYNHYEDMPSLISAAEDRIVEEIHHMMADFRSPTDTQLAHHFFVSLCRYTHDNPYFAQLVISAQGSSFMAKVLRMFHVYVGELLPIYGADAQHSARRSLTYVIAYEIGGVLGILHAWISDDFRDGVEEVAMELTRCFLHGLSATS